MINIQCWQNWVENGTRIEIDFIIYTRVITLLHSTTIDGNIKPSVFFSLPCQPSLISNQYLFHLTLHHHLPLVFFSLRC